MGSLLPSSQEKREAWAGTVPTRSKPPDARKKPRWEGSEAREPGSSCAGHLRPGDLALPAPPAGLGRITLTTRQVL